MPEFMKVLRPFRWKTRDVDASYISPFQSRSSEHRFEYVYAMRYAEHEGHTDYEPWSVRQCALYHSYNKQDNQSIYILISPVPQSKAEMSILESMKTLEGHPGGYHDPLWINQVLWDCYLEGWKPYLTFYEDKLQALSSKLLSDNAEANLSARPGDLHFLESRYLPVVPALESTKHILRSLQKLCFPRGKKIRTGRSRQRMIESFELLQNQVASYDAHLQVLLKRCTSTAHLLEQIATSKNQRIAQEQSGYMMELTKSTVDDSATVRVITVITLVYLSSTVVATILQTPFFRVSESGHLRVSPQLWIYLVITIPLTLATLYYWRWQLRRRALKVAKTSQNNLELQKLPV
ncbi:hypothetical protein LTR37_013719 [Vermiconidia calcicola]|uniref:Uncharacterized protein n=1 Tax=Vermiconidia calcicola TaxID=1690605 RepID=A0ACC3MX46_9PEZI|nr:hypothetical protein LTR37_013719 [Vermiconidia calcicola]